MTDFLGYAAIMLSVILLTMLLHMLGEARKPEPSPFKWGDKHRRAAPSVQWWGSHFFLGIMTMMLATFFLRVVAPAILAN